MQSLDCDGGIAVSLLLQRIAFTLIDRDRAYGSWINTESLRKGVFSHPVSLQQPRETVVSFDAARLGIYSVFLVVLQSEFLFGGPWPRPHSRIIDCYGIVKRRGAGPCPAFHHVQILARSLKIGLRGEIRNVDHEGVALPAPTRVAVPLANAGGQMGAAVHDDIALPPLALTHVIEHRDPAGRLHDASKADAIGDRSKGANLRHAAHQAAHGQ